MSKNFELVDRLTFLKKAATGKKVLHLGCTNYPYTDTVIEDGSLLHLQLGEVAGELWGFDSDERGLEILRERGIGNLHRADLEHLEDLRIDETFEVIVAGEMIEHLDNPGLFLKGIQRFMNRDTRLIVTTINAYCGLRFLIYGFRGNGGLNEPVHPDHVAYYSYSTLKLSVSRAGLDVGGFYFYDIGPEHRVYQPLYHRIVNDVLTFIAPQWCDGVIADCRLAPREAGNASD